METLYIVLGTHSGFESALTYEQLENFRHELASGELVVLRTEEMDLCPRDSLYNTVGDLFAH